MSEVNSNIYSCSRCGSTDFAIDIVPYTIAFAQEEYQVMCRNCGKYQGTMENNND